MNNDTIASLYNQMQETKQCRINASQRLEANSSFLEFINMYYSVIIASLSIFALLFKDSYLGNNLSILSTILSVALTISITYANSIKFKERSQKFKDSFVNIQSLQYKLQNISSDDISNIIKIQTSYTDVLKETETHIAHDYYKIIVENKEYYDNTKYKNARRKYLWHIIWTYTIRVLLVVFPFIFVGVSLTMYY